MHSEYKSRWEMDGVKIISAKSKGKGNTKVAFNDEIVGLAGNCISEKMMIDFQKKREKGYTFDNPYFAE